ncbi:uncharacterized protein LOC143204166 [Rhynchophorus ferrugineus]|uniref:uncharacterized protein LOC143204166 n=1 Tax=Rhynchophorus ferrugineus TaxID=354439 RepID=UPI003FCC87CD
MDFELESDDSFFDEPKLTAKKTNPSKSNPKKPLDDLFGFQGEKSDEQGALERGNEFKPKVKFNVDEGKSGTSKTSISSKGLDWLGGSDDPDFSTKDQSKSSKNDLLDDILPSGPSKTESKRSLDLLDDILPKPSSKTDSKKALSFEDILKGSKAQRSGPSSLEKTVAPAGEPKSGPGSLENILDAGKGKSSDKLGQGNVFDGGLDTQKSSMTSRRGRRGSSSGVTDILGLFGQEQSSGPPSRGRRSELDEKAAPKDKEKDVPDWLGGTPQALPAKPDVNLPPKTEDYHPKPEKPTDVVETPSNPSVSVTNPVQASKPHPQPTDNFQTNISNLQTQESFLLVSLQLKQYEQSLTDIKQQQEEILKKQEDQFDVFLNKYIDKQKNIEQEMLAQQERINEHIRTLTFGGGGDSNRKYRQEESNTADDRNDADVALNKVVDNLKQRHNEEYFLMEESYKKQLNLLEKSAEQMEQRLQEEIEALTKAYEDKLSGIKGQHVQELEQLSEKLKNLEQKHREELSNARDDQNRLIREAKQEFLDQLDRIKEQTSRERDLLADGSEISQRLSKSADKLERNEEILEKLQEKVLLDYNVLSTARERSIETKEKEVFAMRLALEKCREQAEKDRTQLLALVRTLEQKISEQNQNSQEERWALQQTAATLAARAAAFDREVEFSRNSIEREREQLKTFKESLLAEQARITAQLTEEKLRINAEQARLKVSSTLVTDYEVQKVKTEAETAIQVAKELTEKLNRERETVHRQKVELENFRRRLVEKERDLSDREEELEDLRREINQRIIDDRKMTQEAKFLEAKYKEKLIELQEKTTSLSNREKKLAEEKLLISKERLNLYTSMKDKSGHKKCMLCKAEDDKNDLPYSNDADFVRLRMEALDDERTSEVSREDNSHILPST